MQRKLLKPFMEFFQNEASSGIILFINAALAMVLANSNLAGYYNRLLHFHISVGYGPYVLSQSLLHWVNDGLMAVFFFVVGMEIKRELVAGELKSLKKAALPIGAAAGGMAVPALLFLAWNYNSSSAAGWGIPMATDIAFALGALSLLGSRVAPKGLAVFLTALAIVDDLGAVLVIAFFYTAQISLYALLVAAIILAALVVVNRLRLNYVTLYLLLGFFLWLAVLKSGVHATIAGVLLGMVIPTRAPRGRKPMLNSLEQALQPWVAFGIMPIFALANAGVNIDFGTFAQLVSQPLSLGIITGLFFGKQLGIFGTSWLLVQLKLAKLPSRVRFRQIYGASILGGIGFTMSIFVATLAFPEDGLLSTAKISIIIGSSFSAIAGFAVLKALAKGQKEAEPICETETSP